MPLYDLQCKKCGTSMLDELIMNPNEETKCPVCDGIMERKMGSFSFTMTPGAISKHKKRFGNKVPPEYKTSGGVNLYGVPHKD